jgi:hypothetical protein
MTSRKTLQSPDFVVGQLAPLARLQPSFRNRPEAGTRQLRDWMPDGFEHPPHLPIAPLTNGHADETIPVATSFVHEHDVGRHCAVAVERDARPEPVQRLFVRHPRDPGFIGALDAVTRMRELGGELAVVGQEQQPFGVVVEPPDRVDILAHTGEQLDDRAAPLRIRSRRDDAGRFVEQDVAMSLGCLDSAAVHLDLAGGRIDLHAHLGDGLPIDHHAAFRDQLFCGTPRRDAGLGKHLLESHHCRWLIAE